LQTTPPTSEAEGLYPAMLRRMVGGSSCAPWCSELEVPCLFRLLRWPALFRCSESGSGPGAC
jgi:hypothetical protein